MESSGSGVARTCSTNVVRRYGMAFNHPGPRLRDYVLAGKACFGRASLNRGVKTTAELCKHWYATCTSAYGRRSEFRRNPPLRRRDGEEAPLAGHALELVSAALLELEP